MSVADCPTVVAAANQAIVASTELAVAEIEALHARIAASQEEARRSWERRLDDREKVARETIEVIVNESIELGMRHLAAATREAVRKSNFAPASADEPESLRQRVSQLEATLEETHILHHQLHRTVATSLDELTARLSCVVRNAESPDRKGNAAWDSNVKSLATAVHRAVVCVAEREVSQSRTKLDGRMSALEQTVELRHGSSGKSNEMQVPVVAAPTVLAGSSPPADRRDNVHIIRSPDMQCSTKVTSPKSPLFGASRCDGNGGCNVDRQVSFQYSMAQQPVVLPCRSVPVTSPSASPTVGLPHIAGNLESRCQALQKRFDVFRDTVNNAASVATTQEQILLKEVGRIDQRLQTTDLSCSTVDSSGASSPQASPEIK